MKAVCECCLIKLSFTFMANVTCNDGSKGIDGFEPLDEWNNFTSFYSLSFKIMLVVEPEEYKK